MGARTDASCTIADASNKVVRFDRWSSGDRKLEPHRERARDLGIYFIAKSARILGVALILAVAGDLRHLKLTIQASKR